MMQLEADRSMTVLEGDGSVPQLQGDRSLALLDGRQISDTERRQTD